MLASLYGPQRAAWIALQLTPTNLGSSAPRSRLSHSTFPAARVRGKSPPSPTHSRTLGPLCSSPTIKQACYRGSPITNPLNVSLTPNGTGFPAGSPVDAGLEWMVDFNTAVAAGMALRIPLTAAQLAAGFQQIFVYGLRISDTAPAQTWTNLLNAHHYTDGLAFLPQGSPTNNTPDATSAYSRKDPDYTISFATERQKPLTTNPSCDAINLANLTGISTTTFDHVETRRKPARTIPPTCCARFGLPPSGYFLSQMMASVFPAQTIEQARQYALANVFPRGPLPAVRTGTVPYGVLPVTSLFNYSLNDNAVETGLVNFIKQLWPTWLNSSSNAPHMQSGGDPDQNLMSVLGMDASSMNFQGRTVLGNVFLWNFANFLGVPAEFQNQWWQDLALPARNLLNSFGYSSWNPKLLNLGFNEKSFPVNFPTVTDAPLSETDPLPAPNYISWLQTASIADIQAENFPGTKPDSLLYKILRQSVLLLYANLAGNDEISAGKLTAAQISETELVAMQPAATTLTPWQLLARPSDPNPHLTWADYLLTTNFAPNTSFAQLNDFRVSLTRLANLPTAELDRLLTETVDACSHRLDVWATGIATALLNRTRAQQNNSIALGCYGWVENVQLETGRVPVQGTELEAVRSLDAMRARIAPAAAQLPVPLQPQTDNGGYIYAPSPTQAATAAVLRNGYLTHKNTAEEGLLSIDLSSERVSRALELIRGVQEGQSLNALLGYMFEDALSNGGLENIFSRFAMPILWWAIS